MAVGGPVPAARSLRSPRSAETKRSAPCSCIVLLYGAAQEVHREQHHHAKQRNTVVTTCLFIYRAPSTLSDAAAADPAELDAVMDEWLAWAGTVADGSLPT